MIGYRYRHRYANGIFLSGREGGRAEGEKERGGRRTEVLCGNLEFGAWVSAYISER